ncbi:MAG: hypothetical protein V4659_10325 [Pseudomonadota bacterium]
MIASALTDPRPLWQDDARIESPWKSATFWAACALVLPVAAVVQPVRLLLRVL